MKINSEAYVSKEDVEDDGLMAYAIALGKLEAHFKGLAEKVEMGENPMAKKFLKELEEEGFIET